ncbi:cell wall hydrolase [Salinibacter grassmerensis]|uniref:cell wall hydrolase n=1 Tax=Salinibacter grassmerensis TaxID=3040353 RepID=UPI0021E91DC0|nr:cell wall hydrolase [Salinibacter grassmerensis]
MSKRTILLCASVGTLVFSAGSVSPNSGPELGLDASQHASVSETSPAGDSGGEAPSLQQLSAAYAPSTPHASGPAPRSEADSPQEESSALLPTPANLEESTLWLARAIYSETKLPHEQELVAWVVRNRVETAYRGRRTYRAVVLDPYQFSAFNPGSSKRALYRRLQPEAPLPRWRQALWVARYVRQAAPAYRPFSIETRHFYSERSMRGRAAPYWAERGGFVAPERSRYAVDERRFRFFKQIS